MSDDEFGGLDPTTPLQRASKSKPGRSNSRADPGPSRSKPASKKRSAQSPEPDSEVEEVARQTLEDDEDEEIVIASQPTNKRARQKPPSKAEVPATNGTSRKPAKGKGKGRAVAGKASRKSPEDEPMAVDTIEIPEDASEDGSGPVRGAANAINLASKSRSREDSEDEKDRIIARLKDQLRRANEQIASLSKQIEEVHHIRESEPERLLREFKLQAEAQFEVQRKMNDELNAQLARKEPLSKAGHMSVLNLITREAADEEKRSLEDEIEKWKGVTGDLKKAIAQKDAQIEALGQRGKQLESDLKEEVARSTALAQRKPQAPPSVQRPGSRPGGVEDPRQSVLIQFYEDVTNLIIPNMRQTKGKYLNKDDWTINCIYTYSGADGTENDDISKSIIPKSLSFTLRLCLDLAEGQAEPVTSEKQLVSTVNYVPLELDKEPPEFVEALQFLASPFTFTRDQLALFLRTMHTKIGEALDY